MQFNTILNKYRVISFSERDKGDRFERLMQSYLLTDPKYSNILKTVWLWSEFPFRKDFGGHDIGIDLVALTKEGDYWAIQCKCFAEEAIIDKPAVDSFLSTSSREFTSVNGDKIKFSNRIWISTTNNWGPNATESIQNQNPPVTRINLFDLQEAAVDWEKLNQGLSGEVSRVARKEVRQHQQEALEKTHEYFHDHDKGKLIMACGTGKTFTSLRIAENETNGKGLILFLVPSIALLGQSLREWSVDAKEPINPICICSDSGVTRTKTKVEDADYFSTVDLALPASTNVESIVKQFHQAKTSGSNGMTVVFSTYQSIEVVAKAQKEVIKELDGYGIFDLIICDEAHRTTGVALTQEDSSSFIKVHDNEFLQAQKRLYMTATPRLFSDDAKGKAVQAEAILCSMDDVKIYGDEIYRIGFGEAVEKDLLTDYKVLILTLNEGDVPESVQNIIKNPESEINSDDVSKLIGCMNALSKQILGDEGIIKETDPDPMRRAVAFCSSIKGSKKITDTFNSTAQNYIESLPDHDKNKMVSVNSKHIDGTMRAPERDLLLGWLKEETEDKNECRVLTNVRCLSEGVDVPSLDAVMFLSARNSQVDVVQSVRRVMRKSPGKKYGYIIIPVLIPSNVEPDKALDDNERYKVVWTVLNALRAHDDRFNATVNKIDLNKKKPEQILVGRPAVPSEYEDGNLVRENAEYKAEGDLRNKSIALFEELQGIVFAKMVQKVGDRGYWEHWAKNVAQIAEKHIERITSLINKDGIHKKVFEEFLEGLQKNINPSITASEAVEMLSQHIITKPVFEALFEDYSFVKSNPISISMQKMLDLLEAQAIEKDNESLDKFYESVRKKAQGIDNAEGRQKIIIQLYDKFFKTAFPKMAEKLGIVYTPIEVVDFIINSVNDVLQKEFCRNISDENIHILDPFTGTGTFITRLLQSGLIRKEDLIRKYTNELHANEIVLLAYYIATINIENAFHDQTPDPDNGIGKSKYFPFEGIVLTDTFQLAESKQGTELYSEVFAQNSERVEKQMKAPLRVIMGNPPYSIGQKSANDNAQNQSYPKLDAKIANTYAKLGNSTNVNSLYDSYIKAFRWSTDRLDPEHGGIICFVSNGAWLDGNSTDGFRKTIEKEFSSIYVYNLRGNQRTSGELSRKEGGKIFGSGSGTPISITLLVKKPEYNEEKAKIFYYDIGDYLNREEKLGIIKNFGSIDKVPFIELKPNEHGDWLSMRNASFDNYIPLVPEKKFDDKSKSFFLINSLGLTTGRDAWAINFSKILLAKNIKLMVEFYNDQLISIKLFRQQGSTKKVDELIDRTPQKISWSRGLKRSLENSNQITFDEQKIVVFNYRPFSKQNVYHSKSLNEYVYQWAKFLPSQRHSNIFICISSSGTTTGLSSLISTSDVDAHFNGDSQCFPLYYYEKNQNQDTDLFGGEKNEEFIRRDGISDFILDLARKAYGKSVSKEDIFYYVYGFLHSPEYRITFANDLKKMLPRLPLVEDVTDYWKFSKAGRELAELHINYEKVEAYPEVIVKGAESKNFKVVKMRFPKKDQKDKIIFNSQITIENIPAKAYEYIVNGKSAIEWIMERYQITIHKDSGIKNDPNDWAEEVGNPRYILDLLLSIINVSVKTVEIVNSLPKIKFE